MASSSQAPPQGSAQPAPPNFYSMAGQMRAKGGGAAAGAGAAGAQPGQQPGQQQSQQTPAQGQGANQDRMFMQAVTQLLDVFKKLGDMKPNGADVTKFTQAMSDTAHEMLNSVYKGPGAKAGGGTPADSTGDMGDSASAGGLGGAAASAAPPGAAPGGVS